MASSSRASTSVLTPTIGPVTPRATASCWKQKVWRALEIVRADAGCGDRRPAVDAGELRPADCNSVATRRSRSRPPSGAKATMPRSPGHTVLVEKVWSSQRRRGGLLAVSSVPMRMVSTVSGSVWVPATSITSSSAERRRAAEALRPVLHLDVRVRRAGAERRVADADRVVAADLQLQARVRQQVELDHRRCAERPNQWRMRREPAADGVGEAGPDAVGEDRGRGGSEVRRSARRRSTAARARSHRCAARRDCR